MLYHCDCGYAWPTSYASDVLDDMLEPQEVTDPRLLYAFGTGSHTLKHTEDDDKYLRREAPPICARFRVIRSVPRRTVGDAKGRSWAANRT